MRGGHGRDMGLWEGAAPREWPRHWKGLSGSPVGSDGLYLGAALVQGAVVEDNSPTGVSPTAPGCSVLTSKAGRWCPGRNGGRQSCEAGWRVPQFLGKARGTAGNREMGLRGGRGAGHGDGCSDEFRAFRFSLGVPHSCGHQDLGTPTSCPPRPGMFRPVVGIVTLSLSQGIETPKQADQLQVSPECLSPCNNFREPWVHSDMSDCRRVLGSQPCQRKLKTCVSFYLYSNTRVNMHDRMHVYLANTCEHTKGHIICTQAYKHKQHTFPVE